MFLKRFGLFWQCARFRLSPSQRMWFAELSSLPGWTGSSMNGQPWHFIVVEDRTTLKDLGALARTGPYIAPRRRLRSWLPWISRRMPCPTPVAPSSR